MRRLCQGSLILVIVGLVVSFFVFQYSRSAKVVNRNEQDDEATNSYTYEIAFSVIEDNVVEELSIFDNDNINIAIVDQPMYFDDVMNVRVTDIIMKGYEYKYPLISGEYPTESMIKSNIPCAVLGKKLKRNTYSRNGDDYIKVCGDEYLVTGYISADNSTILDYRTVLYYKTVGDGVKEDLEYYKDILGWFFLAQSDELSEEAMLAELRLSLGEELFNDISIIDGYWHFVSSASVDQEQIDMAYIIYVFSVCMVMLVVYYRLLSQNKEFAIKKACGYTNLTLVMGILTELLICVIVAVGISEIIMTVMNILNDEVIIFRVSDFFEHTVSIIIYIAVVIPVLIIVPVYKIIRYNPVKILLDKR